MSETATAARLAQEHPRDAEMAKKGFTHRVTANIETKAGAKRVENWWYAGRVTDARIQARIAAHGSIWPLDFTVHRIGMGVRHGR